MTNKELDVIDLHHFVGSYFNTKINKDKVEEVYSYYTHAVSRMMLDLCEAEKALTLDNTLISEINQHLQSFKFTYTRMEDCLEKLATLVQKEIG